MIFSIKHPLKYAIALVLHVRDVCLAQCVYRDSDVVCSQHLYSTGKVWWSQFAVRYSYMAHTIHHATPHSTHHTHHTLHTHHTIPLHTTHHNTTHHITPPSLYAWHYNSQQTASDDILTREIGNRATHVSVSHVGHVLMAVSHVEYYFTLHFFTCTKKYVFYMRIQAYIYSYIYLNIYICR